MITAYKKNEHGSIICTHPASTDCTVTDEGVAFTGQALQDIIEGLDFDQVITVYSPEPGVFEYVVHTQEKWVRTQNYGSTYYEHHGEDGTMYQVHSEDDGQVTITVVSHDTTVALTVQADGTRLTIAQLCNLALGLKLPEVIL